MKKTLARGAALIIISLGMGACATENKVSLDAVTANKANNFYARERFTQAAEVYHKAVDENPDSPYLKMSLLGMADAYYKDKDYLMGSIYYERFIELYPLDPKTARAVFYNGVCYYNEALDPDRDQENTRKAIENFGRLEKDFPHSSFVPYGRKMKKEMLGSLDTAEIEVIRFYHRVNKNMAAIRRVQAFLEAKPESPYAAEAMFILGDSYQREQAYRKAAGVYTYLIKKYPTSEFTDSAIARADKLSLQGE